MRLILNTYLIFVFAFKMFLSFNVFVCKYKPNYSQRKQKSLTTLHKDTIS